MEAYNSYSDIYSDGTATLITTYDWMIDFFQAPPIMSGDLTSSDAAERVLNNTFHLRSVSWTAPELPNLNPVVANIKGHQISQAGMGMWSGNVAIQAQDLSDLALTKYFSILTTAMDDPETHSTRGRSPNTFRFGFNIYRLNPQGYMVMRWHCYPSTLTDVNIVGQGTGTKQDAGMVTVNFMVDHYTIQFPTSGVPTDSTIDTLWTDYSSKGTG